MTRYFRFFVIFLVFSCWVPHIASAQVVNVPDPNLAEALRGALRLAPNAPITRQAMQGLGGLLIGGSQITNLTGLEHATQLRVLHLHENRIRDISPLAGLTQLEVLSLRENQISNINPLARLTQLEALSVSNNQVSNLSPLAGLTQLEVLHFSTNKINDISPLIRLTQLRELILNRNQISNVRPLAGLTQLVQLGLWDNQISDISPLAGLTQLEALGLSENRISNLQPLARLTQLKSLNLAHNQIQNVSPLAGLTQLEQLFLEVNQISDVSPLTRLTRVWELWLNENNIRDVSALAGLANLRRLRLSDNPIQDTSPLASLTKLVDVDVKITAPPTTPQIDPTPEPPRETDPTPQPPGGTDLIRDPNLAAAVRETLGLAANEPITEQAMQRLTTLDASNRQISSLNGLEHATQLTELYLHQNQISNIKPLAELSQLTWLALEGNEISDVTPLAGLTQLERLALENNNIRYISTLGVLTRLTHLFLKNNRIRNVTALADLVNLRQLILAGNPIEDTSQLAGLTKLEVIDVEVAAPSPDLPPTEPKPDPSVGTGLIPDARLATAVRNALGLGPNAPITEQAMQRLTLLNAFNRQITDLTGLEHATQLKELELNRNQISDLSPLTGLTQLERLLLRSNQISDVSPLAGLVNLEMLRLAENPITDTAPLASLTQLVDVDIEISKPISVDASVEVLIFTGDVWWITRSEAIAEAETTKSLLEAAGIQAEITDNENSVKEWMLQTASDGSVDVLILYGLIPTTIYPPGNTMPDGSVAENWIETLDGNTILNHADYLGYWSTGNVNLDGQVGVQNGEDTLRNLMDIPDISTPLGTDNIPMLVTTDGSALTPSLVGFQSDRPFPLNQLQGDWFAEKILASNTGNTQAIQADPVILRDGNRGRIAIVHQTDFEDNPKGEVAAEIIINYLLVDTVVSISPTSLISPSVGEPLTLNVNVTAGDGVAGYQMTVVFDTTSLRYVESSNGDYLPAGAFFVPPVVNGNRVKLAATVLTGDSNGDGTLATLTFEVIAAKASTLNLSEVLLSDSEGSGVSPQVSGGQVTAPPTLEGDVNGDGVVNIQDLVLVASKLGQTGQNTADVNADAIVDIRDLVKVAGALGNIAAAPSLHPQLLETLMARDVQQWLSQAQHLNLTDATSQRGIHFLEQLLTALIPKESALLPNYPNPFNPETWIPYQLVKSADVTLTIYAVDGQAVRTLFLGHQFAGTYQDKSRAVYWDGRNAWGEPVASGLYFYTLTAGDFSATRKMLIRK